MFVAIYVPYLLMPVLVVARLWPGVETNPFATRLSPAFEGGLWFSISAVFAVFASYVVKWFVLCEPGMLGPLLVLLKDAALLPGGSTCPKAM